MNKMEYRIDAKIIKQLSLFLMMHGINDFDLSFHSNKKGVTFIVKSKLFTQDILDHIQEKLSRQREIEVEVYGWELLGDTDTQNELDILGALIDSVNINKEDSVHIITMKRKYKYNK